MSGRLKASDRKQKNEVEVELGDGKTILVKKHDMTLMVFEGKIPLPMLTAVQKMIEMPNSTPEQRVEALADQNLGTSLLELMREHACKVAIDPKLVMARTDNDEELPVEYLDMIDLMKIWSATAVIPRVGPAEAARFRSGASANAPAPAPPVDDVPPAAEQLDRPADVDVISQ